MSDLTKVVQKLTETNKRLETLERQNAESGTPIERLKDALPEILAERREGEKQRKQEKEIAFWNLVTQPYSSLEDRCKNIAKSISFSTSIEKGESVIGGGTLPDVILESPILLINNEKTVDTVSQLIKNDTPIVPRIIKDQVCLDLRSVFHNQDDIIVQALNNS